MDMATLKRGVEAASRDLAPVAESVADSVWEFAEEALLEFRSAELMRRTLLDQGFEPELEFKRMPTAFAMAAGHGRPRVGILAEYDALPDCGLEEGTWGHGCGHNLLGGAGLLAALIVKRVLDERKLRGAVVLYGCPAEETLAGKPYMARDGAFADLDAALSWHPDRVNRIINLGGAAMDSFSFEFFGHTAHAAGCPHKGRCALDALHLMSHAVNLLREHVPENVRIHYVTTHGGSAPNVVPDYTRLWLYVRGKDREQVDDVSARLVKCARGAATATGTRSRARLLSSIYERIPNDAWGEGLLACLRAIGTAKIDAKDRRQVRRLGLKPEFDTTITEAEKTAGRASTDDDNVSWLAPLASLRLACWPKDATSHHRETTRASRTRAAYKGMVQAGKVLALGALTFMTDGKLRGRVRREFRRRMKDRVYAPALPKNQNPPVRDTIPKRPPQAGDEGETQRQCC